MNNHGATNFFIFKRTMAIQNVKRRLIASDKKSDFTMKSKIGEGTETIISFFIDDEYEKGGTACENV